MKGLIFLYLLFIFIFLIPGKYGSAQPIITIRNQHELLTIPAKNLNWLVDSTGKLGISAIKQNKITGITGELPKIKKDWGIWANFEIENLSGFDQEYILQVAKTGLVSFYIGDSNMVIEQSGGILPLSQRSVPTAFSCLKLILKNNERKNCWLQIRPVYSIYKPGDFSLQISAQHIFEERDRKRLFWQGMFLGIILVMALYNLFVLFAVKDISYLYYVISFVSLGFYFAFYYGFGIEYIWPKAPLWDTYCYTMFVPLTGLARILFTRTYLHTPALLPGINRVLNVLGVLMLMILIVGIVTYLLKFDILSSLVSVIGIMGSVILIMMLVAGILVYYREHYEPAKYFIVANIILVIGAIGFILREMGIAGDNFFTRYIVQYGAMIQLVVFSLGLASRLNRTRLQLTQETLAKERLALEKEREKKELIEMQSRQLQEQVREKTIDLQQKNDILHQTIGQVKDSENKLSQLNQVKDKLFSIVSHDLRNPLATMQSFLKLITEHHDKLDEEEKKKLFSEAQQSLDNLNELLYNLLQWSKSQMNLLQYKPEKISMKTVVDNTTRLLKLNAHIKSININTETDPDLYAYADKEMVEFILRNLLSNAIKFSHRNGTVWLKVSADKGYIRIKVEDNGIGMNISRIRKLEEMNGTFTRRGTEKEKGTGLGLLISKEFIQKNNGTLEIESQVGKGSLFTVRVPSAS